MAKAKKLPSGSWRVLAYDYTDSNGKRIYKSFTSDDPTPAGRREAEKQAAIFAASKRKKSDDVCTLKYKDALKQYIDDRKSILSPATVREYRRSLKADLQDLMDERVCDITQEKIQQSINKEALNHSPKSVRNMHGLLSAVMKTYRPDFAINTALPQKERPNLYVPNDEEVKKIMKYAEGTVMELPILLAAFGPMRRGEICALESRDIQGNIVHVCQNMVRNDEGQWVIKQPKSYAGDRYIDFPEFVANKWQGISGRITPLHPNNISDRFQVILKHVGVHSFRFHDLRHYSASIQHALGIPDAYIMERGGWGNDTVLKNVYRHTLEEKKAEMTHKANDYFEAMTGKIRNRKTILKKYNDLISINAESSEEITCKINQASKVLIEYKELLEKLGWILNPYEGAMMSPDCSTLFVFSRAPYNGQLLLFDSNKRMQYDKIINEFIGKGDFQEI